MVDTGGMIDTCKRCGSWWNPQLGSHICRRKNTYSFLNLTRKLRSGEVTPQTLGAKVIGKGVQNIAYEYVLSDGHSVIIKQAAGGYNCGQGGAPIRIPAGMITPFNARFVFTEVCGNWLMQAKVDHLIVDLQDDKDLMEKYRKQYLDWSNMYRQVKADLHARNCGILNGELVVFDW
jgi:hypothetical protein